jgi:hypothetical protein
MKAYITGQTPTLYQGTHQLDNHWAVMYGDNAEVVEAVGAQFGRALQTNVLEFDAQGSEIRLRWQGETLRVTIDGQQTMYEASRGEWHTTTIYDAMLSAAHHVRLEAHTPVILDSVIMMDRRFEKLYPYTVVLLVGIGMVMLVVLSILRNKR